MLGCVWFSHLWGAKEEIMRHAMSSSRVYSLFLLLLWDPPCCLPQNTTLECVLMGGRTGLQEPFTTLLPILCLEVIGHDAPFLAKLGHQLSQPGVLLESWATTGEQGLPSENTIEKTARRAPSIVSTSQSPLKSCWGTGWRCSQWEDRQWGTAHK